MSKEKSLWLCSECGKTAPKWSGQCPFCSAWNSLSEQEASVQKTAIRGRSQKTATLADAITEPKTRLKTGFAEFDRVAGGGFLSDSISLLIGNPGIGKSTLVLQTALNIAKAGKKALIVSGEESVSQIATRARRLSKDLANIEILNEYSIENALATAEDLRPHFLVLDSIQTLASQETPSAAGSIPQIRTVAEKAMQFAKSRNIPCILIGHVTKEGEMAGPQLLAHLVDAVFVIEGDEHHDFRLLRATKNRFGSAQEVGVFEMTEEGLKEVQNPSQAFLSGRLENAVGSAIFPMIEGSRSFLVELQGLTVPSKFGFPKRTVSGINLARLNLILAVVQNHARLNFDTRDVFANVIGGFRVNEPASDLSLALALASAHSKKPLPANLVACGEIGLSGEVRAVSHLQKRLEEAGRLGFTQAIIPKTGNVPSVKGLKIIPVRTIKEAIETVS